MITSTYRQVTNQLLLEYRTDSYKILNTNAGEGENQTNFFIIQGNDNNEYLVDMGLLNFMLYPYLQREDYYFPGTTATSGLSFLINEGYIDDDYIGDDLGYDVTTESSDFTSLGNILKSYYYMNDVNNITSDNNADLIKKGMRSASMVYDTIRIYISTGYMLNSLSGFNVKVYAKCAKAMNLDDGTWMKVNKKLYLLNYYIPKEYMKNSYTYTDYEGNEITSSIIKMLPTPLYMNSRFYDRYIEITFPAPALFNFSAKRYNQGGSLTEKEAYESYLKLLPVDYLYSIENSIGEATYYRGIANADLGIFVEFSTVSPEFVEELETTGKNPYECILGLDHVQEIVIKNDTSSKYFNAYLYEDDTDNAITYMPVYGDPSSPLTLSAIDINTMGYIETGVIPMYDYSDYDTMNDGMEDFIEMYGEETYKWVIINELSVTYHYDYIIKPDSNNLPEPITEYFTNTIDYTGKTSEHGEFWKSRFIPYIKTRPNMVCTNINVKYVVHLYNRMNNRDLTKTASINIKDPYKYQNKTINTNYINKYSIINKIEKNIVKASNNGVISNEVKTLIKYITSYYQNNNLLIKDLSSDNVYAQGNYTLKLYKRSSHYKFNLYKYDDNNIRVPLDLSGYKEYRLIFPNVSGGTITPEQSSTSLNDYKAGVLSFYISTENATAIMNVPSSERYFSIIAEADDGKSSTMFEGKVEWLTK